MIHLNQNQEKTVKSMVERSHMLKETITNDDIEFFNLNYDNARTEDPLRLAEISNKIKEIMKVDLESAEILRNVYVSEYNDAQAELTRIHTDANMTGLRKLFNSGKRRRAKAQNTQILDKRTLLEQRKDFDGMYDESLRDVCTRYEVVSRNSLLYADEKTKLDRMVSNLRFHRRLHSRPEDRNEDESKLNFLKDDVSPMPTLHKLTYYSEMDRDYKDAAANFRAVYSQEINTDWITRDIVGYTCKIDEVDNSVGDCIDHARNLKLINEEKNNTEELSEAVFWEMRFLSKQRIDIDRWKNEHAELFGKKEPDGFMALKNYIVLQRAIKKLQISKTAINIIRNSPAYKAPQGWGHEEFEEETIPYIFAMHSYVSGLIAQANRHYNVLKGDVVEKGKNLNWEETLKLAAKEVSAR